MSGFYKCINRVSKTVESTTSFMTRKGATQL